MVDYTLHNYFRSSTSVRVRIALALKNISYGYRAYALLSDEHKAAKYLQINPQGLVPSLETNEGPALTQSLAILEYLDETHPAPPLLPKDPLGRARVRALSQIIACDIHPVNNLRILQMLKSEFNADKAAIKNWFSHWVHEGFGALETRLGESDTGKFCHGDQPGMADICLFAQVLNNARFDVDMDIYPHIMRIHKTCTSLSAFKAAMPAAQIDAQ